MALERKTHHKTKGRDSQKKEEKKNTATLCVMEEMYSLPRFFLL